MQVVSDIFSLLPCFIKKIFKHNVNNVYADQMPRSVASDLGLHGFANVPFMGR